MSTYDYVIVGAGSAGCIVANRLSEDPSTRVLLIEAGGKDRSPNIKIPAAFAQQFQTKLDWNYHTDPEPGCNDRRMYMPRGKSLGGSSSMNAMLYVRGTRVDYDSWSEAGCEGWSWEEVLPYFLKSENREGATNGSHGTGGELNVADPVSPSKITEKMIEAARANDYPLDPDYNDGEPDGVCKVQVNQKNGRRWSSADAFLRPASKRPNLTVLTGATVLGLQLDGSRATGVRYSKKGSVSVAGASSEVILCAGAIGSPQILMLSGIGRPEDLKPLGIEPVQDLAVGENLQDHPYVMVMYDSTMPESLLNAEKPKSMLDFVLKREGPLTSTVAEAFLWTRSNQEEIAPDLQFHLAPAYFSDHGFDEYDQHAYSVGVVLVAPESRGRIKLRTADPLAKPSILGNHLTEQKDVDALLTGVGLARKLATTDPLAGITGKELWPGSATQSDDELVEFIRNRTDLLYHPTSTCAMGTGDDAVVDPQLRVRGMEGLRVIDASVMPRIVRGNTNAPTYMIAEKGSDLIKAG